MKNKKALSDVVTTLIIILLVLVAVGVIWAVVSNLLDNSSNKIKQSSKCLEIEISATKVVLVSGTNYDVTLKRSPSGEGEFGAKLIFYNNTINSPLIYYADTDLFRPAEAKTKRINGNVTNAVKIEVIPYFIDLDSNKEVLCSTSKIFEFK